MQRILISELDTPSQAAIYHNAPDDTEATKKLIGLIRTGLLLARQILVTDSMLLDGVLFHKIGPDELASRLDHSGIALPITIISAFDSLAESLDYKLSRGDNFVWQIRKHFDAPQSDACWPNANVNDMWAAWIRAESQGIIRFEKRPQQHGKFNEIFTNSLAMYSTSPRTPAGKQFKRTIKNITRRSEFVTRWEQAQTSQAFMRDNNMTTTDIRMIAVWWQSAYLDTLANVNDADWLTMDMITPPAVRRHPLGRARHWLRNGWPAKSAANTRARRQLRISGSMLADMQQAPPAVFSTLLYATSRQRARLQERAEQATIDEIAHSLQQHLSITPRWVTHATTVSRSILALLAALLALPGFSEHLQWLSLSWLLALAILITLPWFDLWQSMHATHLGLRGVLSVRQD